jgi:hypothetical protein
VAQYNYIKKVIKELHMVKYGTTAYNKNAQGQLEESFSEIEETAAAFRVDVSDNKGRSFSTNNLRWADQASAENWGYGLSMRWFGCTDIRVVRLADEVVVKDILTHI